MPIDIDDDLHRHAGRGDLRDNRAIEAVASRGLRQRDVGLEEQHVLRTNADRDRRARRQRRSPRRPRRRRSRTRTTPSSADSTTPSIGVTVPRNDATHGSDGSASTVSGSPSATMRPSAHDADAVGDDRGLVLIVRDVERRDVLVGEDLERTRG